MSYFDKFKGEKVYSGIPYPKVTETLIAGLGGLLVIGLLYLLHAEFKVLECFIVPFGASAVLVFSAPAAPFSQPRNVIFGHLICALIGVAAFAIFQQPSWWVLMLGNAVAIILMALTKTTHPPAGATVFVPILSKISSFVWPFLPVLVGAVIIVVVGLLYNNLWAKRRYPLYWI